MANENDKRVIKTKTLVKSTVAALLKEKSPDKITITDVASRAVIQRATFYNHYTNIYDVLLDMESDITNHFKETMLPITNDSVCIAAKILISSMARSFRMLIPEYQSMIRLQIPLVTDAIKNRLCQSAIEYVEKKQRKLNCFEIYSIRMYVNGLVDSYFMWRKTFPDADIAEFSRYGIEIVDAACSFLNIN